MKAHVVNELGAVVRSGRDGGKERKRKMEN